MRAPIIRTLAAKAMTRSRLMASQRSRREQRNDVALGVFKNQGDCVSFVATKGKNPPAKTPS
jgi:hypothetical protein